MGSYKPWLVRSALKFGKFLAFLIFALLMLFPSHAQGNANPLRCDFDGDGNSDLAAGVPGDNKIRGAVNVQYSPTGLLEAGAYFLRGHNISGPSASYQRVGSALACGDFDGDLFADLAIGIPGENDDTGSVAVLYGSPAGLVDKHNTVLNQDNIGLGQLDIGETGDRFGEALAAADFNGDGFDDLAIGAPGKNAARTSRDKQPVRRNGVVYVVFGSSSLGLGAPPSAQEFKPTTPGSCCVIGDYSGGAHYGAALAAGDFNFDGVQDLAIGAPFALVFLNGKKFLSGAVHVLLGKANTGLALDGQMYFNESVLSHLHKPKDLELFGYSLATGQFDGLRGDDLAIGAPQEMLDEKTKFGIVYVIYFPFNGADAQFFVDAPPVGDGLGKGERFGWSLTAGNFDALNNDDLAIGIPLNVAQINQNGGTAGAIGIVYSNANQLDPLKGQFLFPGDFDDGVQTPPPPKNASYEFGFALAAADYQGDGVADLFIGVPSLDTSPKNIGGVEIRPGVAGQGLVTASYLLLTQDTEQNGKTWAAQETNLGFFTELVEYFSGERMGHAIGK